MSKKNPDALIRRLCNAFPEVFDTCTKNAQDKNKTYWVSRVLGSGATGMVLCAKRTTDSESFAVKCVEMEGMSETDQNRAQAEVECLLNCDFFSIVKCHEDLAKKDPTQGDKVTMLALVIDYANAGDLRQEIKARARTNRRFQEHEAGMLFLQVLLAIHHVHSRHMIHRDIKSANILLCSNGLVKLGDFGFSKMYSATVSDDVGRTFCGTPYYVAPEIWRRRPYSKKADMFSLGVLLYELLTLKRPFDGANMNEVMKKTLDGRYPRLPSNIGSEMQGIVSSLLSPDPKKRPTSAMLLETPLCKLFMCGLLEIVQTQPNFSGALREKITKDIQDTKALLKNERVRLTNPMDCSQQASSTTVLEGATPLPNEMGGVTIYEGIVRKQSTAAVWKRRYLCIRATLADDETLGETENPTFKTLDLVLSVTKESMVEQCIVTPFSELEDVFPVPVKYTGVNLAHVFAIAYKNGKRMMMQAPGDAERDEWMEKLQNVLGLDDG